jgi:heme-degrading monooxygenase HmoA
MYATVRTYAGARGLADELVKREDEVRSLITGIEGFHAYYIIKTADGAAATVSIYENEAGAEESVRKAREYIQANLPDLAPQPPQVTTGEVVLHLSARAGAAA